MIRTERFTLRAPREDDLDALYAIFSDPEAMAYWSHPAHKSPDHTKLTLDGMIASHEATGMEYVVEHDGEVIGKAGMWQMGEIGYIVRRDHWGKGVARETVAAVVAEAFTRYPELDAITADVDPRNEPSAKLLDKLGFRQVKRIENSVRIAGEWCDSVIWQIDRPAQAARTAAETRGETPQRGSFLSSARSFLFGQKR